MKGWLNKQMSEADLITIRLRSQMSDEQADQVIKAIAERNANPNN